MNLRALRPLGDGGASAVEWAILGPVAIALLSMLIAVGFKLHADSSVHGVAAEAAREASLQRDPATARTAADQAARRWLTQRGVDCTALTINVDTSGFARTYGESATVTVDIACTVGLGGNDAPWIPDSVTVRDAFASPLDPYRADQGTRP